MTSFLTLKKSNCKNCYKCIRHCPVKSIRFSGNQAHIIGNECILCGQCFTVCPQNAKEIADSTEKVRVLLQGDDPVIVSLAPSFVANYEGVGIENMRAALKKLGFYDVEETAYGATIVKNEYERMISSGNADIIISSCCHSVNLLIQKHFPALLGYLADTSSPMQAHCKEIKRKNPSAKTVFIGPCLAKKDEAEYYEGIVDAALTFEELSLWLKKENISLDAGCERIEKSKARLFPTVGGILKTMKQDAAGFTYAAVDGVQSCIAILKDIEAGRIHKCFIEMSACTGSCIGGPVMEKRGSSFIREYSQIINYAGSEDFETDKTNSSDFKKSFSVIERKLQTPSETEIASILRQMGKIKESDELNCGSCGYNTCREKAVAIYQGKADISMCLPFLKDRAESFSDNIVGNTPNAIIVLNESLEVQQINKAAQAIMNIRQSSDVLGEPVIRILEPQVFMQTLKTGAGVKDQKVYLAEYKKYVEQTVVYDKEYKVLICIMRDITDEEREKERKEKISKKTVEIADNVVDKQMRIVQEIASLLGETAAETKIALAKLKESINDE